MHTKKQVTDLSFKITGYAIKVHKTLGAGLLESVYAQCLIYELEKHGHKVETQVMVSVHYDELIFDTHLRLDLMVDDLVVVELKACESILPIHEAQLLTYMKLAKKPQGLLINFFTNNITRTLKPFVNEYFSMLPD